MCCFLSNIGGCQTASDALYPGMAETDEENLQSIGRVGTLTA